MYACGITPYSDSHLGHGVAAIRFDTIRRYLAYRGFDVTFVQNVTNVDDKLIAKGRETGQSPIAIATHHTKEYRQLLGAIGIRPPDFEPDVISYMPKIITYIDDLIRSGHAYATDQGNVYFRVRSISDYGKLSRRTLDSSLGGTRVETETDKQDPHDFALWKKDDHPEMSWDSPWGRGRPGWHIECSVMSNAILGPEIDIHCGGMDLLFPHHENEIAQCEAHNGQNFVRYWVHSGLLNVGGQKMSKSLGNFLTLRDAVDKYGAELLKFTVLKYHYRSEINLVDSIFEENLNIILKAFRAFTLLTQDESLVSTDIDEGVRKEFETAMDDDINTARAIAVLQKNIEAGLLSYNKGQKEAGLRLISSAQKLGSAIGLWSEAFNLRDIENKLLRFQCAYVDKGKSWKIEDVERLIDERQSARDSRDFSRGDALRLELEQGGITLLDGARGQSRWMFRTV